jgi:hypothetical protein
MFPRDSHCFARLQVPHATRYLFIPGCFNGLVGNFKTVEQSVGQCSALLDWESKCAFQEIRNLWTHGLILPRGFCLDDDFSKCRL